MKKLHLFTVLLYFLCTESYSQRSTIYIATQIPIDYQVYIDDYIQYFSNSSSYKIINVPNTAKKLSLYINTKSGQTPSVPLNTAGKKEIYYSIIQEGENYRLVQTENHNYLKQKNYTFAAYIAKPKPVKLDSGYKQTHSCKVNDSIINQTINNITQLKEDKAKRNFIQNYFSRKCLSAEQIRSIGYRLDDDELKLNVYQDLFLTSLDRSNYKILKPTFKSETFAHKFQSWLETNK